jgi:hypothetical protein
VWIPKILQRITWYLTELYHLRAHTSLSKGGAV